GVSLRLRRNNANTRGGVMPEHFEHFDSMTVEDFAALDLAGRPFLSEQGRVVTRGIVAGFRYDAVNWYLDLVQVDYLDKATRAWNRKRETDEYTSSHSMFVVNYGDAAHTEELHLEIGGYGMTVFIGAKSDAPWRDMEWRDILQTDHFEGGVLGETHLP
ncbi:MAG: hypothetical protein AAFO58_10810, partial [Pseudomonadota bacterium]